MNGAPSRAFFETCAQLIPLLAIAVLLERNNPLALPSPLGRHADARRRRRAYSKDLRDAMLAVLAVIVGEVAALVAIAGTPTKLEAVAVLFALGILGSLLVLPLATMTADGLREGTGASRADTRARLLVLLVAGSPMLMAAIAAVLVWL